MDRFVIVFTAYVTWCNYDVEFYADSRCVFSLNPLRAKLFPSETKASEVCEEVFGEEFRKNAVALGFRNVKVFVRAV